MLVLQKQQRNRGVLGAYIGMNGGSYRHTVTRDLLFSLNPAPVCYFDFFFLALFQKAITYHLDKVGGQCL